MVLLYRIAIKCKRSQEFVGAVKKSIGHAPHATQPTHEPHAPHATQPTHLLKIFYLSSICICMHVSKETYISVKKDLH